MGHSFQKSSSAEIKISPVGCYHPLEMMVSRRKEKNFFDKILLTRTLRFICSVTFILLWRRGSLSLLQAAKICIWCFWTQARYPVLLSCMDIQLLKEKNIVDLTEITKYPHPSHCSLTSSKLRKTGNQEKPIKSNRPVENQIKRSINDEYIFFYWLSTQPIQCKPNSSNFVRNSATPILLCTTITQSTFNEQSEKRTFAERQYEGRTIFGG